MTLHNNKPILKFSDYEDLYLNELQSYKNEFEDNTESEFIKKEIIFYERRMAELTIEKTFTRTENDYLFNKTNDTINKLREKRRKTYFRIIEFLKEKSSINNKKEPETGLPKWFPIGLGFATGEIQNLNKTRSAREIAKDYNLPNGHNYISNTIANTTKDPKNIYSDLDKLKLVYTYCIDKSIKTCDEFKKNYDKKLNELK